MTPSEYVSAYLNLPVPLGEGQVVKASVKNHLESGLGVQSVRSQSARAKLIAALSARLKIAGNFPDQFVFEGVEFRHRSILRVFMGKGAPDEIQTVLWMASRCDLLDQGTLSTYCDNNIGLDPSGFVANYWGIGRPSSGDEQPVGWSGLKPRYIWHTNRPFRRKDRSDIRIGDAMIYFRGVKKDNPDQALTRNSYGSETVHIGVVASIYPVDLEDRVRIRVAESSGAMRSDGATGVNIRDVGEVTLMTARSLVYFENGGETERCYFVGPLRQPTAYEPDFNGSLADRVGRRA